MHQLKNKTDQQNNFPLPVRALPASIGSAMVWVQNGSLNTSRRSLTPHPYHNHGDGIGYGHYLSTSSSGHAPHPDPHHGHDNG